MSPKIKICGITNLADAKIIAALGVDYLGFVIDAPESPRRVSPETVKTIVENIKGLFPKVKCVGVFVDQSEIYVRWAVKHCGLDAVQLHDNETPGYCRSLKDAAEVWKAIIIKNKSDVERAEKYRGAADKIMFDAGQGGGEQIDYALLDGVEVDVLAGGLGPDNVNQAVERLQPSIIDMNSKLETVPGKKDIHLVKRAMAAARSEPKKKMKQFFGATNYDADQNGYFGQYGGRYAPELILPALKELEREYREAKNDPAFAAELFDLYKNYSGRPTPLYFAKNLTEKLGGAKIYLKNEGLNHTGAHKINHCLGQALMAKRMGKKRLIAETGAGQHGLATATVAAKFGFDCAVYMGAIDYDRQRPNVFWMEQLGAKVIPVEYGDQRLKDAVTAAIQDWAENIQDSYYLLGSALGPHPYPTMVRDFQHVVGLEVKEQLREREGRLPDYLVACVGGGSNAIGLFNAFLDDQSVKMIGVEAGGKGIEKTGGHAARLQGEGKVGVAEGYKSYFLQNEDGQIERTHSLAAGLDYAGIGPEHAYLFERGRVQYTYATDAEVLAAFKTLARTEGIFSALESAHAVAEAIKLAPKLNKDKIIVVNVSGRGDKDIFIVAEALRDEGWKEYLRKRATDDKFT
ncbi:MAG: tryptophan synthase subunit beta [Patescibacteria group bacterium]